MQLHLKIISLAILNGNCISKNRLHTMQHCILDIPIWQNYFDISTGLALWQLELPTANFDSNKPLQPSCQSHVVDIFDSNCQIWHPKKWNAKIFLIIIDQSLLFLLISLSSSVSPHLSSSPTHCRTPLQEAKRAEIEPPWRLQTSTASSLVVAVSHDGAGRLANQRERNQMICSLPLIVASIKQKRTQFCFLSHLLRALSLWL